MEMSVKITVDSRQATEFLNNKILAIQQFPKITRDELERGMNLALGLSQIYVPVSEGVLRDSIHLEEKEGGISIVADARNKYGDAYGIFPEEGWSQPQQAYLKPAVDEAISEMLWQVQEQVVGMFQKDYFVRGGKMVGVTRNTQTGRFEKAP